MRNQNQNLILMLILIMMNKFRKKVNLMLIMTNKFKKNILTQYSLIVCVNHALLGFYFRQSA